jgi:hypothetical protein
LISCPKEISEREKRRIWERRGEEMTGGEKRGEKKRRGDDRGRGERREKEERRRQERGEALYSLETIMTISTVEGGYNGFNMAAVEGCHVAFLLSPVQRQLGYIPNGTLFPV